jgi:putative lipoic acid-binding regulatory protein
MVKKDGIAGLWEHLKDQFQDLKATVMDAIMDIIQSQVIQAGIKWILSLLSPVGAFVKAVMAIIDVVKFFIQRAAQIGELVKAFTQSVSAIASGKVGAVAASIENALAKAIPVLIGLLASILGISGLADKVLGVIRKIRQRITAGITKFWNFMKEKGGKLLSKVGVGEKKEKKEDKKKAEGKHFKNMDSEIAPETFTMNGEEHTLTFEKGEIYMASKKAKLSTKLGRAINQVKGNGEQEGEGKKELILHQLKRLKNVQESVEKEMITAKNSKDEKLITKAQANLDKLSKIIQNFGNEFKLNDLLSKEDNHKKYKPQEIKFTVIGDKQIKVIFEYAEDAKHNGVRNFETIFSIIDADQRKVNQTSEGKNLALKVPGTRGYTESAGKLAKKEYGIDLNSAHVLGDWFMGTGYKKGANLLLTSKEFNQKTMYDAEKELEQQIKAIMINNKESIVTFDMTVSATFETLEDDGLIAALNHDFSTIKDQKDIDIALLAAKKIIQGKQDPRRCETVKYEAYIYMDGKRSGRPIRAETNKADIWLNKLFNI